MRQIYISAPILWAILIYKNVKWAFNFFIEKYLKGNGHVFCEWPVGQGATAGLLTGTYQSHLGLGPAGHGKGGGLLLWHGYQDFHEKLVSCGFCRWPGVRGKLDGGESTGEDMVGKISDDNLSIQKNKWILTEIFRFWNYI